MTYDMHKSINNPRVAEHIKQLAILNKGRIKSEETRKKISVANTGKKRSAEICKKFSEIQKRIAKPATPELKAKLRAISIEYFSDPEARRKMSVIMKGENNPFFGKKHSEESILKMRKVHSGIIPTEETRNKMRESHKKSPHTKEQIRRLSILNKGHVVSEETRRKLSVSNSGQKRSEETCKRIGMINKGRKLTEEHKQKLIRPGIKNGMYGRTHTPDARSKIRESQLGGYWYGNVRYKDDRDYCELWDAFLRKRIRVYWGGKSILSGKTKEENHKPGKKPRELTCHHVYWQPKACCIWDEDAQGYYAIINIGTNRRPNKIKYYIKGDPNKFVLLTSQEHGEVAKDKLMWIKKIEAKIDEQGGKCYYTKEEWELLKLKKF